MCKVRDLLVKSLKIKSNKFHKHEFSRWRERERERERDVLQSSFLLVNTAYWTS